MYLCTSFCEFFLNTLFPIRILRIDDMSYIIQNWSTLLYVTKPKLEQFSSVEIIEKETIFNIPSSVFKTTFSTAIQHTILSA